MPGLPVQQLDLDTSEVLRTWASAALAARSLAPISRSTEANNSAVTRAIRHDCVAYGYRWRYAPEGTVPDAEKRVVFVATPARPAVAAEAVIGLNVVVEFSKARWYRGRITATPKGARRHFRVRFDDGDQAEDLTLSELFVLDAGHTGADYEGSDVGSDDASDDASDDGSEDGSDVGAETASASAPTSA